ncbi:MAG: 6-phosphogluconolactonase [Planctomycetota bacterium]
MKILPYDPRLVANQLLAVLQKALDERGKATLAIPGGRSPGAVLEHLAKSMSPALRANLYLFWVDERAVPLGHSDRNDAAMLAAWQKGGDLPGHVLPMPAEKEDLNAAAAEYAQTLEAATGESGLDACLLGIGEDGHIASLFPNHSGLIERRAVFAVTNSPKPPPKRLTLSLPVLSKAKLRVVLALGQEKWPITKKATKGQNLAIPVSLLPANETYWYTDDPEVK